MKYCGSLIAPIHGPIIYFIFSYDVLYIGETQVHPVQRWSAHLFAKDGFHKKIREYGDPEIDYLSDIRFFAYYCNAIIENFPETQWKTATQAVEHETHCYISQYRSKLGNQFNLISDTRKTAPRRFKQREFAKEQSKVLISSLIKEIDQ